LTVKENVDVDHFLQFLRANFLVTLLY